MKTVRFAPSPTGHLHIGGVRTALFNFFFAKNQDAQYVLRIEDTDLSRSNKELAEEIIKGLEWLGIHWDQGPFYQSDRFDMYRKTAVKLLEEKKAYRCFCTPQELEERRTVSPGEQQVYKYDRKCLQLSPEDIAARLEENLPHVIRFFVPEGRTFFKDSLHKEMKSENSELDDFVILKSGGSPTYHLSVVVDDSDMGITHVVRGDDHLSNTFKQVLLFRALEIKPPKFAHLPLILGPDKKKLSKRHGETSILEFKRGGYLPEAVINYLSQLSWIPADSKKLFSMEELSRQFALSKLSKSSPVFDYDKLRFMNGKAIQQKKGAELLAMLKEDLSFLEKYAGEEFPEEKQVRLIDLVKPRMKTLRDFVPKFEIYMEGRLNYENPELENLAGDLDFGTVTERLNLLSASLESLGHFDAGTVETALRDCAEKSGIKAGDLIHPARYALTSENVSPSIFEVFQFFGKGESLARINLLVNITENLR